jgi:N-acetylglutamate synthase-like GNAT family acetyltransferase
MGASFCPELLLLTFGYDLEFNGRQATITELFIVPEYRSRRLGSKMIKLIEATCRRLNIGALELQVERDNVRAQSLYRKLGFRAHDRIPMSKMLRTGPESNPFFTAASEIDPPVPEFSSSQCPLGAQVTRKMLRSTI